MGIVLTRIPPVALNKIIAHLDPSDGVDRALAQDFIHKIGERVDDTSAGAMEVSMQTNDRVSY